MVNQVFRSANYAVISNNESVLRSNSYAVVNNNSSILNVNVYTVITTPVNVPRCAAYMVIKDMYLPYEDIETIIPFIEKQFPVCVSFGSTGGPGFKTSVFEVDSGLTSTEVDWERIRAQYTVNFDHVPPADIALVENFFYGMRGMAIGFRYKDWSDYTISNQNFLIGDGVTKNFQIYKRYNSGGYIFDRLIKKPIASTVQITLGGGTLVNGTDYTVNHTTGLVTFSTAPAANVLGTIIQAEFDVPVRFDTDKLDVSYDDHRQLSISRLKMIEVLT